MNQKLAYFCEFQNHNQLRQPLETLKIQPARFSEIFPLFWQRKQGDLINLDQALNGLDPKEYELFTAKLVPKMVTICLDALSNPPMIPLLVEAGKIELSRDDAFKLIVLAFFNIFRKQGQNFDFPHSSFGALFAPKQNSQISKLRCHLNYFIRYMELKEVSSRLLEGKITLQRVCFNPMYHLKEIFFSKERTLTSQVWERSEAQLRTLQFTGEKIERHQNCVIVDFANKYIGGGVLGQGCVQEEIMLTIMPEALTAVFLCSRLEDHEVVYVDNAIQYSGYSGYASQFQFVQTEPANYHQTILVLDALHYYSVGAQYQASYILRELNKALIGFSLTEERDKRIPIVTGKWGCGAFNGNVELKLLIQVLAFSQSRYPQKPQVGKIVFSTFGNEQQEKEFSQSIQLIISKYQTVGALASKIFKLGGPTPNLLKHLLI